MSEKMSRNDSSQAMLALAAYGEVEETDEKGVLDDSDIYAVDDKISDDEDDRLSVKESDAEKRPASTTPVEYAEETRPPKLQRKATKLVSYDHEDMEKADEDSSDEDETADSTSRVQIVDPNMSLSSDLATVLSRGVQNMAEGDIQLPPEPPGKCSRRLQDKITNFLERMHKKGYDLNEDIQNKKYFRNPSIYEKLILFCGIDEKGTNYPPEIYDPHMWGPESFYEDLARSQLREIEKREREKKDRTKIEFQTGTKKPIDIGGDQKRKSKWDSQVGIRPTVVTTTAINPPTVSVTTSVSGSKTTVISAVGTISKKSSSSNPSSK